MFADKAQLLLQEMDITSIPFPWFFIAVRNIKGGCQLVEKHANMIHPNLMLSWIEQYLTNGIPRCFSKPLAKRLLECYPYLLRVQQGHPVGPNVKIVQDGWDLLYDTFEQGFWEKHTNTFYNRDQALELWIKHKRLPHKSTFKLDDDLLDSEDVINWNNNYLNKSMKPLKHIDIAQLKFEK